MHKNVVFGHYLVGCSSYRYYDTRSLGIAMKSEKNRTE